MQSSRAERALNDTELFLCGSATGGRRPDKVAPADGRFFGGHDAGLDRGGRHPQPRSAGEPIRATAAARQNRGGNEALTSWSLTFFLPGPWDRGNPCRCPAVRRAGPATRPPGRGVHSSAKRGCERGPGRPGAASLSCCRLRPASSSTVPPPDSGRRRLRTRRPLDRITRPQALPSSPVRGGGDIGV